MALSAGAQLALLAIAVTISMRILTGLGCRYIDRQLTPDHDPNAPLVRKLSPETSHE